MGSSDLLKAGWSHYLRRAGEVIVFVENNTGTNTGTSTGGGGGGVVAVKTEGGGTGTSSSSSSSSSTSRDKSLVDDLLAFQERMECVLRFAFSNHEGFRYALKSAFEHFLNLQPSRPAKLLADFVDRKMRGEKGLGDAEVDAVLDKVRQEIRQSTIRNPSHLIVLSEHAPVHLQPVFHSPHFHCSGLVLCFFRSCRCFVSYRAKTPSNVFTRTSWRNDCYWGSLPLTILRELCSPRWVNHPNTYMPISPRPEYPNLDSTLIVS